MKSFFNTSKNIFILLLLFALTFLIAVSLSAQNTSTATQDRAKIVPLNTNNKNVVIDGFDVVSYFEKGKPQKGSAKYSYDWQGATWFFASKKNKELFASDPYAYAPQYGGFCAYAVAKGYTADIDPEAWTIHKGKLYLNFSLSVRKTWRKKMEEYITQADINWQTM